MDRILDDKAFRALKVASLMTIFVSLFQFSVAQGSALGECKAKLDALAIETREKYVLSNSIITDELLSVMLNSQVEDWGAKTCNEHILEAYMVVLHEGVHMIDLNYKSLDKLVAADSPDFFESLESQQPKFFLSSGEFLRLPFPKIPMPLTIYSGYWQNSGIAMHKRTSAGFRSKYESYVQNWKIATDSSKSKASLTWSVVGQMVRVESSQRLVT